MYVYIVYNYVFVELEKCDNTQKLCQQKKTDDYVLSFTHVIINDAMLEIIILIGYICV